MTQALVIVLLLLVVVWALVGIVIGNTENFNIDNGFNYAQIRNFDMHDFIGKWEAMDAALAETSSIEMRLKEGRLWTSFGGRKFIPVRVRHLSSNSKMQILVDDPLWRQVREDPTMIPALESPVGTYDLEIIHQLPTRGDPIVMLKMKKQGTLKWGLYVLGDI